MKNKFRAVRVNTVIINYGASDDDVFRMNVRLHALNKKKSTEKEARQKWNGLKQHAPRIMGQLVVTLS